MYSFTNANWGQDLDTRKSTLGVLHKLGESTIDWSSKLQPIVSLYTFDEQQKIMNQACIQSCYAFKGKTCGYSISFYS